MKLKIKGFIFTLDAVFALILTSFVVSIILYLHFAPQMPAQLQSPDSASILNFLVSQPISLIGLQHITQAARQNSWPQFGNSNITFSSSSGLNALMLAFQYKADNSISTLPVINNGTVFLGTGNGQIIELNSSSGSLKKNFVVANSNVVAVSSTVAYADITLHNSQSQATPAPFQQLIQFNSSKYIQYETQNLGNIRFYLNGQELYSWCESGCSIYANAIIQIPITLHNSQSQATTAPFQQMITVNALNYSNYEATNLGNIRFYSGQQELYSWCESNCSSSSSSALFWIKLPNGIPAQQSVTVNMTFEPKTVNYDGVYAGEAPQLSPSYGEYDNGASVFNFYDNFAGSGLSNKWIPDAIIYSVNNGFTATATGPNGHIYSQAYKINSANSIADFFGSDYQFNTNWTGTGFSNPTLNVGDGSWVYGYAGNILGGQGSSTGTITSAGNIINAKSDQVFSIISVGPIVSNYSVNYLKQISTSGTPPSYPLYPTLITAYVNNAAYNFTNPVFIQWYRVRAYPPGDKMPAVNIGNIEVPSVTSMPPIESIVSYKGLIAVANNTAVIGIENGQVVWKIGVSVSTPLAVEDNYLVFGSGDVLYLYYINGTQAASYILPQKALLPIYHNGEFIEATTGSSTNYLIGLAHVKNSLIQMFSSQLQAGETTEPAISNQSLVIGSSKSLYSFYFNGLPVWPINSIALPTQIQSIAAFNRSIFVQTSNSIFVVSSATGNILQSIPMPTSNNNALLSISLNPKELFALPNSNYFYGLNITAKGTLKNFFNITLPQTSSTTLFNYSEVALAGNNAYLISNNTLYAFGACYLNSHITTAFSAAAYFYLTGQGGCANSELFNEINATDSGMFINKIYGPSIHVATFNGHSSLITNYNKALLNNQPNFTISAWIYMNSFKYNSHLGTSTIYSEGNPFVRLEFYPSNWSINGSGALGLQVYNLSSGKNVWITSNAIIPINKWTFVVGQLLSNKSGSYFILYINGLIVGKNKGVEEINSGANEITIGGLSPLANGGLPAFNGSIANLQIYNTSLTENQIGQIYSQGIGGIPLSNAGLLAWYPLQGNANDYSGHGNVGFPENVTYTNSGYAPASLRNAYSKSVSSMQLSLNINGTNKLYNVSVITWH